MANCSQAILSIGTYDFAIYGIVTTEEEFNSNMHIEPIEYTNGRFYPSFTLDEEWGDD